MSGFGFTDAQEMLRRECKKFAEKEILPGALARAKMSPNDEYSALQEIRTKMAHLGWLSWNMPAKYGGQPIDFVSVGVLCEELSKADIDPGRYLPMNIQASGFLTQATQQVQDEWYPPLMNGQKTHCFAFSEPGAGSDFAAIQAKATREGESYILNGEKSPSSYGMRADVAIVAAKTDTSSRARGISMFLVPSDLDGVTRTPISWMGDECCVPASFMLDNVRVPAEYRLGEEGKGFYATMHSWDWIRVTASLACLAAAEASLEEAMSWAKHRVAFGRPIVKFEGVSFKIAEHYTLVEAARLLCYRALWLRDQGQPCTKEAAMVKWLGPWEAVQAMHDCMIILGHVGYSGDCLIQKRLRNIMGNEIGGGTANIQKLIVIRELMGRDALPY